MTSVNTIHRSARLGEPLSPDHVEVPPIVRALLMNLAMGEPIESSHFGDGLMLCAQMPTPQRDVVLGSLMTAAMMSGPDAGAITALLKAALELDHPQAERIPTDGLSGPTIVLAGSGKKGERTLNVSTPAALVAAAAGANIVKVGSTATSSALGSRDLVRALGFQELDIASEVHDSLLACHFAFVAIEPRIPQVDALYGGRFYAPNPFSFGLAPLASPVRGDLLVFGLSHPRVDIAAEVLTRFGINNIDVMTTRTPSGAYLDEIGPDGDVRLTQVRDGVITPVQARSVASLTRQHLADPYLPAPTTASEAVDRTVELLSGAGLDRHHQVVALNAGYLLLRSGVTSTMAAGIELADDVLRRGGVIDMVPRSASLDVCERTA